MTMPAESTVPVLEFRREAETTKFCRDCRWCDAPHKDNPQCLAPQNFTETLDLVSGRMVRTPLYEMCRTQRSPSRLKNDCGEEGRWFEPRTDKITCHHDDSTAGNPTREFDYVAYRDPEGPSGRGATRDEAVADLLEKEGDR